MEGPGRKRRKTVLPLIFLMACVALPSYARKHKADRGEVKTPAELERAVGHVHKGSSLYKNNRIEDAIVEYRKALQGDSEEPYWHQDLGRALEDKSDLPSALEEYQVASQQSPLDSGLRSKCEELAKKLQVNVQAMDVASSPAKLGPNSGEPLKLGDQVTAPVPTDHREPPFSTKARSIHYQGTTVLQIVVDAQGNVTNMRVVKPLGLGLDETALETVQTWKFKPAMRGNDPVSVRVMVEITFRM